MRGFQKWSDMTSDLRIDNSGNVRTLRDDEAISQSIKNILSTVRGERVRSDIGSGLLSLLFEPVDDETAEDIQEVIEFSVRRYENRITLLSVRVIPYPEDHYYEVILRFRERSSISVHEMRSFLEQQQ